MIDLNPRAEPTIFARLGGLLLADYDISSRATGATPELVTDELVASACEAAAQKSIIYTAFDGDHQYLSGHMRALVMRNGSVPANPESILGYKETVDARTSKKGVILDDLAILSSCDTLWVFTEERCSPSVVQTLAEGVVIELVYFLKVRPQGSVFFVSPIDLISGRQPQLREFSFTFDEVSASLLPQQAEVLHIVRRAVRATHLRALVYHIVDPLDFKYARWLQADCYNRRKAPLVPSLAVDLRDAVNSVSGLGEVVCAWVGLMSLTSRAYLLPSFSRSRGSSVVSDLLHAAWEHTHERVPIRLRSWRDYRIPRAQDPEIWAITYKEREGRTVARRKSAKETSTK